MIYSDYIDHDTKTPELGYAGASLARELDYR